MPDIPEIPLIPLADLQKRMDAVEAENVELRTAVETLYEAVDKLAGAMPTSVAESPSDGT